MASTFLPHPRTTTAAICSASSLLLLGFTLAGNVRFYCCKRSKVLYLSPRPEVTSACSGTSSYLRSWCLFGTYAPLPSHLAGSSHHELFNHYRMEITSSWGPERFCCRNKLLATNSTAASSAPPQRCQHLCKSALLTRQQHNGLATLLAILLISNGGPLLKVLFPSCKFIHMWQLI